MKQVSEILEHMFEPFKPKLNNYRCLRKIISLMPINYKKYITKIDYKGDILYIGVSHPGLRQEIFYRQNMILNIIKTMHKAKICTHINPKKIKTFHDFKPKNENVPKIIKFYVHKVDDFEIKAKNPIIKKKFEEIKELLKSN